MGPLPPPATTTTTDRTGLLLVAARVAWTATLHYVQKTLHHGAMLLATQDGMYEYARDTRPRSQVPHLAGCHVTPQRSRPKPQQPDFFSPRYASILQICQPRAPHLPAQLCEQPAQASVPLLSLFLWFRPVELSSEATNSRIKATPSPETNILDKTGEIDTSCEGHYYSRTALLLLNPQTLCKMSPTAARNLSAAGLRSCGIYWLKISSTGW